MEGGEAKGRREGMKRMSKTNERKEEIDRKRGVGGDEGMK